MERRFLPALSDPSGGKGAYASRWEGGWKDVATSFAIRFEKRFQIGSFEGTLEKLEDRCGCYAVLYQPDGPGENHGYVAYVGYSKQLATELQTVVKRWHQEGYLESPTSRKFVYTACYIQNDHHAREYEYMLIRYYAPPWNTRFSKQPRRGKRPGPESLRRAREDADRWLEGKLEETRPIDERVHGSGRDEHASEDDGWQWFYQAGGDGDPTDAQSREAASAGAQAASKKNGRVICSVYKIREGDDDGDTCESVERWRNGERLRD